jgi:MFS family permease
VLLLGGLSSLMLCLTHAGDLGPAGLAVLGLVFAVCAVLFVRQEHRAAEPVVNFELWRTPLIAVANATTLLSGVVISGVVTFVPTFAQGVLGASAIRAGFALSAMSIGWPIATVVAGRLLVRVGARRLARIGGLAVFCGSLMIALAVQFSAGVTPLTLGAVLLGAGMGTISITFMVTIQSSVPWAQRGAATASNMLMRMLGNAVGSALFGGLLNLMVQRHLEREGWAGRLGVDDLQQLLGAAPATTGQAAAADPAVLTVLREGMAGGLHWVFWGVCLAGVVTLLLAWRARNLDAATAVPVMPAAGGGPAAAAESPAIPLRQG